MKHKINFEGLKTFLETLNLSEIETTWQKPENPKLVEGHSMDDIEFFKKDKMRIPLGKVINYGEPFLIDALGNDLSIVVLSKRKYKLPTGRAIHAKFVATMIEDCRKVYGTALNGYWKIPEQFIELID